MNCSDVQADLPLFVGRDLESVEIEAVKAHLTECEPCRLELKAAEAARGALLTLHGAELDDEPTFEWGGNQPVSDLEIDLWPGIESVLAAEGLLVENAELERPAAKASGFRLLAGGRAASLGTVAAAAALVIAWFGFFANTELDEPAPAAIAQVEEPVESPTEPVHSLQGVDLAAKSSTGGLRPIDHSEGLAQEARIFDLNTPTFGSSGTVLRDNPNSAASFHGKNGEY